MPTDIVKRIRNFFAEQEAKVREKQWKQFTFFILGFVLFYLLLNGIMSLFPEIAVKAATGLPVEALLNAQGIPTEHLFAEDFHIFAGKTEIVISWLCAGVMEIIILVSAILASFGVAWKKKVAGAAAGIATGYVFNLARVWATVNIILTQNPEVADFTHDILFRIMLFVYITGFYVVWFWWSENGFPERLKILKA